MVFFYLFCFVSCCLCFLGVFLWPGVGKTYQTEKEKSNKTDLSILGKTARILVSPLPCTWDTDDTDTRGTFTVSLQHEVPCGESADVCPRSQPGVHIDLLTQWLIEFLGGHLDYARFAKLSHLYQLRTFGAAWIRQFVSCCHYVCTQVAPYLDPSFSAKGVVNPMWHTTIHFYQHF